MKTLSYFGATSESRVLRAIGDLQKGKGVLLVDDENRENEADIIFAASTMQVSDMALMIRECSGIVCLCLKDEFCKRMQLPQMVNENTCVNKTAFTISIEARNGVSTGVSASDRIMTIRTAIAEDAKPEDLVHPGHVFPLRACDGGVLERQGHTEGSVDLSRLAGLGEAAVLCELTNIDGTMARLPQAIDFAIAHDMMVIAIKDIIEYRTIHHC